MDNSLIPQPVGALLAALIIGVLYTEGGIFQWIAGLVILSVLLTPANGEPSLAEGMIKFVTSTLNRATTHQ